MALDLRGRRVLITGGLGFIGSNLASRCLALGAAVTVYDCLDPRSGGNLYNVHAIEDSLEIILNDVRNFEGISACIRGKDVLFNCAAYTSHPNSMKEPLIDIDVNCKGVINVLEAARRFNPGIKIVHLGTSTQIGPMRIEPIDELHPEFPVDIYSANKMASEKYVLVYGHAYGMRTTVIRLANAYGPRSNIRSADFGFMNYFVGLALAGREITVFGAGDQLRNVTYVDDCTDALILAADDDRANGDVFFAVSDQHWTVGQVAAAIVAHIGGRVRFVDWPKDRASIEIGHVRFSDAKIRRVLGWKAQHTLADGLVRTQDYFRDCLAHYL